MNRFAQLMNALKNRQVGRTIGFLMVLMTLGWAAWGQVGTAGVLFLQIEPDSRGAAMGNANVALADNANALFWNPAGLAFQNKREISITHSPWLPEFQADLFIDYLVGTYHVPDLGTFGAHITYFNLGEHESRDEQNNFLGTFRAYDLAVGGSFGYQVNDQLALGTGLRLIYSNLAPGQSVGAQETKAGVSIGVDLGLLYKFKPIPLGGATGEASVGFNLANMGPKIQYSDSPQADPIPTNMRFGWSFKFKFDEFNSLTIANDFNKLLVDADDTGAKPFYQAIFSSWKSLEVNVGTPANPQLETLSVLNQLTIGLGLEYWYKELFAFRSGYFYENPNNGNRRFLTFGAGVRYNIVGVDFSYIYALEQGHPLANTMRFSVLVNFGQ